MWYMRTTPFNSSRSPSSKSVNYMSLSLVLNTFQTHSPYLITKPVRQVFSTALTRRFLPCSPNLLPPTSKLPQPLSTSDHQQPTTTSAASTRCRRNANESRRKLLLRPKLQLSEACEYRLCLMGLRLKLKLIDSCSVRQNAEGSILLRLPLELRQRK